MNRFAYIDALRGYAILAVIAVHVSQGVPGLAWPWRPILDQGSRGVQLFYVASAITLCMSWNARNDGAIPFYIRRFFRIAPMFWLAIVFFTMLGGLSPRYLIPDGIGWWHVAMTATFIHGVHPETISSVVPGGWTIANEMMFYAIFPLLVVRLNSVRSSGIALIISLIVAEWSHAAGLQILPRYFPARDHQLVSEFLFMWLPNQFPAFMVGMFAFHLGQNLAAGRIWKSLALACILGAGALAFAKLPIQTHLAYSLVFGLFAICLSKTPATLIVNRPVIWMGKISFGAYLWHFAWLSIAQWLHVSGRVTFPTDPTLGWGYFLVLYASLTVLTAATSWVTYRLVEQPFIGFGQQLIEMISRRKTVVAGP